MAIELIREPACDPPCEHCCFCYTVTPYWHAPKDVAVCKSCAASHDVNDVPTKREWCEAVLRKFPRLARWRLGDGAP